MLFAKCQNQVHFLAKRSLSGDYIAIQHVGLHLRGLKLVWNNWWYTRTSATATFFQLELSWPQLQDTWFADKKGQVLTPKPILPQMHPQMMA